MGQSTDTALAALKISGRVAYERLARPKARQFDDVVRRQDRANKIRLRRGVNFIQMMLPFAQLHELLDALC